MFDLLEIALGRAQDLKADFCDLRLVDETSEMLRYKNRSLAELSRETSIGIGIRVLHDGGWGFSATQSLAPSDIVAAVDTALALAKASSATFTAARQGYRLAPEPAWQERWLGPCQKDPFSIQIEDKLALLQVCADEMAAVPGITLSQGFLHFIRTDKYFASTEGARIHQTMYRTGCLIEATASDDQDIQRRSYPCSFGQYESAGYEMVEHWAMQDHARRIATEAVELLTADRCPEGYFDTILGGSQLGLQIHESMGHPSELDRALGEEINFAGASFLKPELINNLRYGSPLVHLVADATAPGAMGSFGYDDEGVQAQRIDLVKDGIFKGYLSSRDTASILGLERSGGCMRAQNWCFQPIIRMTNISLEPGKTPCSLDELISDTGSGLYLETNRSWSIDSMRYNFQFSTEYAREIKNGKLGRLLKNPSYSGITTDFWQSMDALCDRESWVQWGTPNCGKGQPMQVMWTGHGAAPARFRRLKIGAANA